MSDLQASSAAGRRGPAEHNIRDQIIDAAGNHFSHYGYAKTTVADLAAAIGFSKAYIYKFFDSKQAIGEAICTNCLGSILISAEQAVADGTSATDKMTRLFETLCLRSTELFFNDRKLYDIAAHSSAEKWPSSVAYVGRVGKIITEIIQQGRASGEFERKTPADEIVRAIVHVLQPFMDPVMLQYNLDVVTSGIGEAARLVLRSLAP